MKTFFTCLCLSLLACHADRPHIILMMADDQGWGDTGYNGHPFVQTPALDGMARDGFVFNRFYAAAPVCSPTRASVLTGRNPIRCKVPQHGRYMRPHEQTIAEALKANGYVTGIFGKVHLGSGQPDTPCNPSGMGFDEWCVGLNFFDNDPYLSRHGKVEHRKGKGSELLMDDAIAFLQKHKDSNRPTFTVIWFPSPHGPFGEKPDGPPLYTDKSQAGYFREITLLDQQVGRLRNALDTMGMADQTLLWYCSDNGGLATKTSGGRMKKGSIYEGGLRVPSVVVWPDGKLQGRTDFPAMTSDIYPTLLAITDTHVAGQHPLDGIDLVPVFRKQITKRPKPMGFWHDFQGGQSTWSDRILKAIMEKQHANAPTPHDRERMLKDVNEFPQFAEDTRNGHAAWTDWPWKLHFIARPGKWELYNLEKDPMETNNLATHSDQRLRLKRMKADLNSWMNSVIRSINGKDYK